MLFRHLGLEPDTTRIPVEALMLERLRRGAYRSRGLLADALLVATVETEVGVWALDAAALVGAPRLALAGGRIVVADDARTLAPLFSPPAPVTPAARRLALYAITAAGVPALAVEEALWTAWDVLDIRPVSRRGGCVGDCASGRSRTYPARTRPRRCDQAQRRSPQRGEQPVGGAGVAQRHAHVVGVAPGRPGRDVDPPRSKFLGDGRAQPRVRAAARRDIELRGEPSARSASACSRRRSTDSAPCSTAHSAPASAGAPTPSTGARSGPPSGTTA